MCGLDLSAVAAMLRMGIGDSGLEEQTAFRTGVYIAAASKLIKQRADDAAFGIISDKCLLSVASKRRSLWFG
jgi:hypothetical protein